MTPYKLTREQLRLDLADAYADARRHKGRRGYVRQFEADLDENLDALCAELYERRYKASPSDCFIITDPKKREVFAAAFRDRIVHHLYYNYVHSMFERTFIADSYSCIKGRGTSYGIDRLEQHIRRESQNYNEPCYVLKMDIKGYFMHIDRQRLLEECCRTIDRMATHKVSCHRRTVWAEVLDLDFVRYLTREIVLLDCTMDCRIKGPQTDWDGLPEGRSLFTSGKGHGLPIGNLTSQLFSNVYLNVLDQFMKRELKCRYYGRYVDDFYVVSADRDWLRSLIPLVRDFLSERLGLELHKGKLRIDNVRHGVEFLGAFLKPWRRYLRTSTLKRVVSGLNKICSVRIAGRVSHVYSVVASYLGILSNYSCLFLFRPRLEFASFRQSQTHQSCLWPLRPMPMCLTGRFWGSQTQSGFSEYL